MVTCAEPSALIAIPALALADCFTDCSGKLAATDGIAEGDDAAVAGEPKLIVGLPMTLNAGPFVALALCEIDAGTVVLADGITTTGGCAGLVAL